MRQTLGIIISVSLLAAGCASLRQETRMYPGPFGRTEVGGIVVAADPAASKVLIETYDGDLWIYDVDPAVRGRLSSLRVGDEIILAFDDRISGTRAMALNVIAGGTRLVPPSLRVALMLPRGVTFGAPATSPSGTVAVAGGTNVIYGNAGTVFAPGGMIAGGGVIVPGFVSFSQLPAGTVLPQTAVSLGLGPSAFIPGPTGVTTLATSRGPFLPGREPITAGNFSPGTVSPGVTTANPSAPGQPVVQGPFTPGTVAPGVSVQQGNAPPPQRRYQQWLDRTAGNHAATGDDGHARDDRDSRRDRRHRDHGGADDRAAGESRSASAAQQLVARPPKGPGQRASRTASTSWSRCRARAAIASASARADSRKAASPSAGRLMRTFR